MSSRIGNIEASRRRSAWYAAAMWASAAAAAAAAVVAVLLVVGQLRGRRDDPLNSPEMDRLRAQLARSPRDNALKQRIRELDVELRRRYFRHVTLARRGNWLLVGCAALFLAAFRSARAWAKRIDPPRGKRPDERYARSISTRGRLAVAMLALLLASGALLPAAVRAYIRLTAVPPPPPHFADPNAVARAWPWFRGPAGGVSAYSDVPVEWDANASRTKNILWKAPVALPGKSSPVVWGGRVFLTGATMHRREVFCYDAATGRLLWKRRVEDVPNSPAQPKPAYEETGYAAPTPACDDRRVFALFANGDLACFDHDGRRLWARSLGQPKNQYSHGSSLVMYRNLLLVLWDQGSVEDYMSKLYAFDAATGRLAWERRRPVGSSWATPLLYYWQGRPRLVASANPWVIAYDPASGGETWRAKCMEGADAASSPVYADGMVYAVSAETKLYAIRCGGTGDVTASHVAWSADEGLPDLTSPLTDGRHVWLLETAGLLTCYDAKDGRKCYQHELERSFHASPSLAGGRLYLVDLKGETFVLAAGGRFKLIAVNPLGEMAHASPA
ncbi:MAG: PQQ-like beta-propeller repeat protein, partial [Planctomycetes bacterium]|nr:PQQ-like beta-propeller repeat protein [Planctomycetota bacterium]